VTFLFFKTFDKTTINDEFVLIFCLVNRVSWGQSEIVGLNFRYSTDVLYSIDSCLKKKRSKGVSLLSSHSCVVVGEKIVHKPTRHSSPPTMSSRYSTRSTDSRKRTALGDISNAGGAKKTGAKKASSDVRPTPPVAVSTTRSSFGGSKNIRASQPHVNIDAVDANDPQACSKYVNEIYAHFRNTEGKDHDVLAGVHIHHNNKNKTCRPFPK
jgi:hypothetical protein